MMRVEGISMGASHCANECVCISIECRGNFVAEFSAHGCLVGAFLGEGWFTEFTEWMLGAIYIQRTERVLFQSGGSVQCSGWLRLALWS